MTSYNNSNGAVVPPALQLVANNNNNATTTSSSSSSPQTLIRASIDELRLIGVMLRTFAKSKSASELFSQKNENNNDNNNDNNKIATAAALANVLEYRFATSLLNNNNTEGLSGVDANVTSSTDHTPLVSPQNLTSTMRSLSIASNNNYNNISGSINNTLNLLPPPALTKPVNTVGTGGVASLLGSSTSFFPPSAPANNNNNNANSKKSNNTNLINSSDDHHNSNSAEEISGGNPQLLALASKVDAVLRDLKISLSKFNNNENSENQLQGTNTTTNNNLNATTNVSYGENNLNGNTRNEISSILPLIKNNNNNNQNPQIPTTTTTTATTDHRKLFPRAAPGWTRRVEPSVIDRYAREKQEERHHAMLQAASGGPVTTKNSSSTTNQQQPNPNHNNINPTPSARRNAPPLLSITATATTNTTNTTTKITNSHNAPPPIAPAIAAATVSSLSSITAPVNFAQQLLASAPSSDMRDSMELQELTQAASASIYMALRACAVMLRAESASIFVYFGGEMICCACIGVGAVFPPCSTRFASGGSLAHAVLTSGVALHRTVRQDAFPLSSSNASSSSAMMGAMTKVDGRGRRRSVVSNANNGEGQNLASSSLVPSGGITSFLPQPPTTSSNSNKNGTNTISSSSSSVYPIQDTMMVPIFSPFGGITNKNIKNNTTNNNNENNNANQKQQQQQQVVKGCRAVLQLQNKNKGTSAFTEVDETKASFYADMLGYFMHLGDTANLDYRTTSYDPIGVQKSTPFIPANPMPTLSHHDNNAITVVSTSNDGLSTFFGDSSAITKNNNNAVVNNNNNNNNGKNYISRYFEDFEPRKLIHRSVVDATRQGAEAGSGIARRAVLGLAANEVGPAPSLREIDSYVANLRDSWRRAVDETVTANAESTTRCQQIRELKTELEKSRGESTKLAELLQLERFSAGDYVNHYQELRHELENFLQRRTAGSEELFSWTSQNLTGGNKEKQQQQQQASATKPGLLMDAGATGEAKHSYYERSE